jgi:hypothetical protein
LHSSFNQGGKELRCVQLINAFGAGRCIRSCRPCPMRWRRPAACRVCVGRRAMISLATGQAYAQAIDRAGVGHGGLRSGADL